MENLTLEETPPLGGVPPQMQLLGPGLPPPQNQQLPPQMFTTAAQLLDMTDSKEYFTLPPIDLSNEGAWRIVKSRRQMLLLGIYNL